MKKLLISSGSTAFLFASLLYLAIFIAEMLRRRLHSGLISLLTAAAFAVLFYCLRRYSRKSY
ncbi:MAG: hypothetical protein ACI4IV_02220 [Acutalibacteraceae bacterium]